MTSGATTKGGSRGEESRGEGGVRGIGGAFEIGTCLPSPRRRRGSLAVVPRGLLQQVALAREKSLQAVHVPAVAPLAEVAGEVARVAVTGHSTRPSRRRRSRRRPRDPCESRVRRAPRVWREERRAEDQIEGIRVAQNTAGANRENRPTAAEANRIFCERGNEIRAGARRRSSSHDGSRYDQTETRGGARARARDETAGRPSPSRGGVDRVPR